MTQKAKPELALPDLADLIPITGPLAYSQAAFLDVALSHKHCMPKTLVLSSHSD